MKKRLISCLLVTALGGTLLLSGCGSNNTASEETKAEEAEEKDEEKEEKDEEKAEEDAEKAEIDEEEGKEKAEEREEDKEEKEEEKAETEEEKAEAEAEYVASTAAVTSYSFGGDIVGQGAQALDDAVEEEYYVFECMDSDFQIYNDNFTSDTQQTNVQTMISAGYDGIMIFGWNASLYIPISDLCEESQMPLIYYDQIPTDPDVIAQLDENEYYVGCVGVDNYLAGANIATHMLEDGITKALINGGSVGDVVHDARVQGFTDTFEAGGGEVLSSARSDSPSDATTKQDDMISGFPDAEATYCLTGDYAIGALAALDNYSNVDMAIYCSDTTSETIPLIEDGTIVCGDGGSKIAMFLAACLLYNYVDGNIILDENGNAPDFSTVEMFEVNADNAAKYDELFLSGHPMTKEEVQQFIGPDVTYQTFVDFIDNFSSEEMLGN